MGLCPGTMSGGLCPRGLCPGDNVLQSVSHLVWQCWLLHVRQVLKLNLPKHPPLRDYCHCFMEIIPLWFTDNQQFMFHGVTLAWCFSDHWLILCFKVIWTATDQLAFYLILHTPGSVITTQCQAWNFQFRAAKEQEPRSPFELIKMLMVTSNITMSDVTSHVFRKK